jgi:hypothetical protein
MERRIDMSSCVYSKVEPADVGRIAARDRGDALEVYLGITGMTNMPGRMGRVMSISSTAFISSEGTGAMNRRQP